MDTEHKIYMNYIHPSSLLRQLSDLWKADQLCDAVITVDKTIVAKAHKVVLFAVSPKLKSDSGNSSQSPILDVCMPAGVSHRAVHAFLQYIYEGYLILTRKLAKDLLKISKFLKINCLADCCSDYLDSLDKADDIIVLDDDEPSNSSETSKNPDFCHIRTSAVDKSLLKENQTDQSPSKPKKHKSDHTQSRESPVHTFSQPSPSHKRPSQRSDSDSRDNVSSDSFSSNVPYTGQNSSAVKVKTEVPDSCAYGGTNQWQSAQDSSMNSDPNTISPAFQQEFPFTNIKEEPQEVSVDQDFLQNVSSSSMPPEDEGEYADESWYSETSDPMNQSAPVISMSSPVAGSSQGGMLPRSMTPFSSLKQMRAQQSIKRSIQSSVSAARRARNIQMAGAASAASSSMNPGEGQSDQEGGSLEFKNWTAENQTIEGRDRFVPLKISCDLCEASFSSRAAKKEHMSAEHYNRVLSCKKCGKFYKWRSSLGYHMMHCKG